MGLDMYLKAESYVGGWNHGTDEEKAQYDRIVEEVGLEGAVTEDSPSLTVNATVAYWRKANHIHRWFVENVQSGEDECRPHNVSREQLIELRETCKRALGTKVKVGAGVDDAESIGESLLPTQEGFFFGGTEYDEWYWRSVQDTVEQIERVLKHVPEDCWFIYQSSW